MSSIVGRDKYRTYITFDGSTWEEIRLTKAVTISGGRDKNCYDFKRKSSKWKFKRSENAGIYDTLLAAIKAPSTTTTAIKVKLDLYDDWVTLTGTEYEGRVGFSGIAVNEDAGVMELAPEEVSDYLWYNQHKGDKHDVLNEVANVYTITYDITTVIEEYFVPDDTGWMVPNGFDSHTETIAAWNNSANYVSGYHLLSWARHNAKLWHAVSDNINSEPAALNPDWEILIDPNTSHEVNIVSHAYRQTCDLPFTVSGHTYLHGNGVYEEGFPAVTAQNTDAGNCDQDIYFRKTGSATPETGTMNLITDGNLKLYDHSGGTSVLNHLLTGSGLTAHSHILSDATNPITGQANHLTNLRLAHNKFIKAIDAYDTAGEMTLEGLLNDLCDTFNLQWMISGTNLIIEHIEYFKKGLSYSGTPGIYADLTDKTKYIPRRYQVVNDPDPTQGKNDQEYSYSETDLQEYETFHFIEGYDFDGQIKYGSVFAKKGEKLTHDITLYISDFAYLFYFPSETADDCYSLIACDSGGKVLRRTAGLRWIQGTSGVENPFTKTKTNFPNGDLMWNNLLNDFWIYQRAFKKGSINGKYTEVSFSTIRPNKKQRKIRFPRLEAGAFDPTKLITTNLGNGVIESFEIDTDTDFINVYLLYENEI